MALGISEDRISFSLRRYYNEELKYFTEELKDARHSDNQTF